MSISGKTGVFGVIGDPIEYTLSPILQNAAFKACKLDCAFLAFKVAPTQVADAINGMRALGIQGLNVTMPHKQAVIAHLDQVDSTAKFLNSVNTIQNHEGKLFGFNTDGVGAIRALKENGADPKGKRVLLLGAGGAARAIAYALTGEVAELVILNRTEKQAADLAALLKKSGKVYSGPLTRKAIASSLQKADILINATSIGMKPNPNQSPVQANFLSSNLVVMDIVYNPLETKLAKEAKDAGAKVVSGVEMLLYQGAASFEIWTGKTAPVDVMRKAALNHLESAK